MDNRRSKPQIKPSTSFDINTEGELLSSLVNLMPEKGRPLLKKVLAGRQITVNGNIVTSFNFILKANDKVVIDWNKQAPKPYFNEFKIIFEDDAIIVINKNAGLLSIATNKEREKTAYFILRDYIKNTQPDKGLYIVHRLDRDTSGLMLFAKNEAIREKLQRNWDHTAINRKYVALTEGVPDPPQDTIKTYLEEDKAFKMNISNNPIKGQLAVSHYKTLKSDRKYALLEVTLETGKKNQIRAHLASIGHPIAGDKKYGARSNPLKRLGLHAQTLSFPHPVSNQTMNFDTSVPISFYKIIRKESDYTNE
ncbi:MAG: RluA family pseudouridine synthase [Sphingobacteriia bacterium]|nr:RluA family pseudouridine synthase [Sphingobacteriia bacterium]